MNRPAVEVTNLSHTYPDGTAALDRVSFRIAHGESVGVIGANGAGKSTLLLHLNGCLTPTAGAVQVGDAEISRSTLPRIRRMVGMVFQNPDDQLFMPTVAEDVLFGPLNQGLAPDEAEEQADRALATVGAMHLKSRPPHKLSSGEKRSSAIAAVLAMAPEILVMDEPSSGLDPRSRRILIDLLRTFPHTKIIATHDLGMVRDLCERTVVLCHGTVAYDGPTPQVLDDSELLLRCGLR
jgi:cobalt/nickel transport system ATP-binding protein